MADPTLTDFIDSALRAGASRAEVETALAEAGWSAEQIAEGLRAYADVEFVVPVPRPKMQISSRDAFVYLVTFGALYLSAYNLGDLLFQLVNLGFPDELRDRTEYMYRQIRFACAALIVAYPIYLYASTRIVKDVAADPARRSSAVRRWLTYLTLFIAGSVIVGDLISLIFNFLSGELSVRFFLKVLIVGSIAGTAFAYYLWLLRSDAEALVR